VLTGVELDALFAPAEIFAHRLEQLNSVLTTASQFEELSHTRVDGLAEVIILIIIILITIIIFISYAAASSFLLLLNNRFPVRGAIAYTRGWAGRVCFFCLTALMMMTMT